MAEDDANVPPLIETADKYGKLSKVNKTALVALAMQRDNSFGPRKALMALSHLASEKLAGTVSLASVMSFLVVAVAHCNAPAKVIRGEWLRGVKIPVGFVIRGRNGMMHNFNNTAFHSLGEVVMYIFQDDVGHFKHIITTSGLSITARPASVTDNSSEAEKIRAQRRMKNEAEWKDCVAKQADEINGIREALKAGVTNTFRSSVTQLDMSAGEEIVAKAY
jgi:hypothetical protein